MDDLSLAPRGMEGAMITDEEFAIERCIKMVRKAGSQDSAAGSWREGAIRSVFMVTARRLSSCSNQVRINTASPECQ